MKILRLELVGYRRFKLARIARLDYTPSARQQLILGTNGSGKSSLLDELSPLPARHSDYRTGGSKRIEIEHQGVQYVLISNFKSGNKHSFYRDDVELNEGGTYQVQLRLVKEHLRYTEKLHDLLIGRLRFTELRPIERREQITQLSEDDWTFPMGVYQSFKSKARDIQGAYRHQQARLTQETDALSKLTDSQEIQARAQDLKQELSQLLIEITPNIPTSQQIRSNLDSLFASMGERAEKLLHTMPAVLYSGEYRNLQQLDEDSQGIRTQIDLKRFNLERSTSEHAELEAIIASFGGSAMEPIVDIDDRIVSFERQLEMLSEAPFDFTIANAKDVVADSELALSELQSIMQSLPDNSDGRFGRKALQEQLDEIARLEQEIDRYTRRLSRGHDRLAHLKGTHDSTCPKCQHIWKEGVDPREVAMWEEEQQTLPEQVSQLRAALQVAKERVESIEAYGVTWRRFRTLHSSFPRLQPLFEAILNQDLLINRPGEQQWILSRWSRDLRRSVELQEAQAALDHLRQMKRAQEQFGESGRILERMQSLEREIAELTPTIQMLNGQLAALQRTRGSVQTWLEGLETLDSEQRRFVQLMEQSLVALKNGLLEAEVERRHLELADIQRKLSDRDTLQGIIADLTSETERLRRQHQVLSLLTTAISPTEGLIADRLRDAIFSIIEQMNTIIGSVWTHELKVLECGFDGADLDYKFPVQVESPEDQTPDISKASKGQREIIDIAFKLTAMLYLGMLDYPLFLDEPGEGFDEQHRDQIMSLVRQMLDSGHYSQLFMVSHVASSHGAFLDAQALVLDASNITLPGTFNEHATLE